MDIETIINHLLEQEEKKKKETHYDLVKKCIDFLHPGCYKEVVIHSGTERELRSLFIVLADSEEYIGFDFRHDGSLSNTYIRRAK